MIAVAVIVAESVDRPALRRGDLVFAAGSLQDLCDGAGILQPELLGRVQRDGPDRQAGDRAR